MIKITVTKELQKQIDKTGYLEIDEAMFANHIKAEAIRAFGESWDFSEEITGRDVHDLSRQIARDLEPDWSSLI